MPLALIAAMLASLGIHAAALFLPDLDLSPTPELPVLQAEIVLQPRRAPLPAAAKMPPAAVPMRPTAAARPPLRQATETPAVAGASAEAAPASPGGANSESPAEVASAASAASGKPPVPASSSLTSPALPPGGSIRYIVTNGETDSLVGRAEHRWQMQDGSYRIVSTMETAGLAALFRTVRVDTESRGRLTDGGLLPETYVTRRSDKPRSDEARFDWQAGVVRFGSGAEVPLPAGTQDLLSFNYQLGWLAKTGDMAIVSGRKLGSHRLELVGREMLETPAGNLASLHFRAIGATHTEVWLAEERFLLPVRIRHIDKKGDRYELFVQEIRIDPQ